MCLHTILTINYLINTSGVLQNKLVDSYYNFILYYVYFVDIYAPFIFLMKIIFQILLLVIGLFLNVQAVTTSWTGALSTNWSTAGNWTNGVPTSTVDAVIGDASFTGAFQPSLTASINNCLSLNIGSGTQASTLSFNSNKKNLTVWGDVVIGTNGTIAQTAKSTFKVSGNWTKTGTYTASNNNAAVIFAGIAQSITGATTFRRLTINAGSITTINSPITAVILFSVSGTVDPLTNLITLTGSSFSVQSGGKIKVQTATFAGNYSINPTLSSSSIVEYSSTTLNQSVSAFSYGTLVLSGGTIKTAVAGFTLQSSGSGIGDIQINTASTFDISTFTVNRGTTVAGGALTLANGCTLRVAGAFPLNFTNYSLGSTSLTEYYGGAQTIYAVTYGNLTLSSVSGAITKTFASSAITVVGNLNTSVTAGSMIANTAANLTVNGAVTIGASVTFNGLTFSHIFGGNLTNSGTFTSSTGTITMIGPLAIISGTGTYTLNNLVLTRTGTTAAANTNLTLTGNFTTTSPGTFTHTSGSTGTITMSGATKVISGLSIVFNHLIISGTSITTTDDLAIVGNLTVNASAVFTANGGTISFTGVTKSISNAGTLTFYKLFIASGSSITTASSFFVKSDFSTVGTISASAGTVTFNGTTILSGAPNLFNVTLNGTILTLSNNAVLGIASAFALTAGTFNVTLSTPNTVNYNGVGAQSVLGLTYNRLALSTSGTKTAAAAITTNESITINTGATFNASTFTHTIYTDWFNYGTFTPSSSTVQFLGSTDSYITGATTFSSITLNKTNNAYTLFLNNNISVATANMLQGEMRTVSNAITITTTRTGTGIILGTITRTHVFNALTAYEFEGPSNTVLFSNSPVPSVTSVTIVVTRGSVLDYPYVSSIDREYNLTVAATGAYSATLRLHYLDTELQGNDETSMVLWKNTGSWVSAGKTANDATANWVEYSGITNLVSRWTLAGGQNVVQWTGTVGTDWATAGNWQVVQGAASTPPGSNDIVLIGSLSHTNQPIISANTTVRALRLYSTTVSTLTLSTGSLTVSGSVLGSWSGNAAHTLDVGNQTLNVGGSLSLSNGTIGQTIGLVFSSGSIVITENLLQSAAASITCSSSGNISLAGDYTYTSGAFAAGSSTFTYNGISAQIVAPVTYNNLTINKASAAAIISSPLTINGNLTTSATGQLELRSDITVGGNVAIGSGTSVNITTAVIKVGGNWTVNGTFIQGSGTVEFNGTGNQNIGATTFNQLVINKASGTAFATGNLSVNEDVSIQNCALDIATFNLSRTALGGTLILTSSAILQIGGASNAPSNFAAQTMSAASTVEFNGTVVQNVPDLLYNNLVFSNGGTNAKVISTQISVASDLTINSGATLNGNGKTISLSGNWTNNGTYNASSGTLRLLGTSKILGGTNTFYNVTCLGSYSSVVGTTTTLLGVLTNNGTFVQNSTITNFYGNLINNGAFTLNGTTNVMGQAAQTLANNGTFSSGLSGVVNYNGTVSTLFYSTNPPQYATVNINNTAGITAIQPWTVLVGMTVGAGASFDGGGVTHSIRGNFTNNGTVVNNGGGFTFSPLFGAVTINLGANFNVTGVVTFAGSLPITLTSSGTPIFGSVVVTNTNASGITASSNWSVVAGITVKLGSTLHGGVGCVLTLSEDLTVNGIFEGGTSTVVMNGVGDITGTGDILFNNLTLASTNSALIDIELTGNLVNNGTFDPTTYSVMFSGTSAANISGTTTPVPFNEVVFSKTGTSVTLLNDIYVYSLVQIVSGSTLLATTKVINIEGDWFNNGTFNEIPPTSTVNFLGTVSQTISGSSNTGFGHVIINNSTGVTLLSAHTINGSLTLTSGIITSSGLLTVNLNLGSIAGTGSGNITGNINVTKSLFAQKFHYISSPLVGMTLNDWNDDIAANPGYYYWYDESVLSSNYKIGWTNTTNTTQALTPQQGFIAYTRWSGTILDMTSTYNHPANPSNVNLTLTRTGPNGADGWNLVGNPFPGPLDWNATGWTRTNVYSAIYFWDPANARYSAYVSGAGVNGGTQYIPAMQAYFVRVDTSGASNKSIAFGLNSTPRVTSTSSATPTLWRTGDVTNMLKLTLKNSGNNATDETIVRFLDGATNNFDGDVDAYKLLNDPQVPSFYSSYQNNIYSVNSVPPTQKHTVIPLVIKVPTSGAFSILSEQLAAFDADISITLVDSIEHTHTNLKTDRTYQFNYDKATQDKAIRFYLNFDNAALTVTSNNAATVKENMSAKYYNNTLFVYFPNQSFKTNHISIVDLSGNEVFVADNVAFSSGVYEKQLKGLASGVYVVNVSSGENVSSTKIFIDK